MPSYTLTETLSLITTTCCQCGIVWAQPASFDKKRREDQATFYCPNGHGQQYTESTAAVLRRQLDATRQRAEWAEATACHTRDQLEATERSRSALRGVVTRQRRRAAAGVCPCCNRTFQALADHMANKHPGYATTEASS